MPPRRPTTGRMLQVATPPQIAADEQQAPEYETSIQPVPLDQSSTGESERLSTKRVARGQMQRLITTVLDHLLKRNDRHLDEQDREHLVKQTRSVLRAALEPGEESNVGVYRYRRVIASMRQELEELRRRSSQESVERISVQEQSGQHEQELRDLQDALERANMRIAKLDAGKQQQERLVQHLRNEIEGHKEATLRALHQIIGTHDSIIGSDLAQAIEDDCDPMQLLQESCEALQHCADEFRRNYIDLQRAHGDLQQQATLHDQDDQDSAYMEAQNQRLRHELRRLQERNLKLERDRERVDRLQQKALQAESELLDARARLEGAAQAAGPELAVLNDVASTIEHALPQLPQHPSLATLSRELGRYRSDPQDLPNWPRADRKLLAMAIANAVVAGFTEAQDCLNKQRNSRRSTRS